MRPFFALAGLGGMSSTDELYFDVFVLVASVIKAAFMPIFSWDHPPTWMIWIQPVIVLFALVVAHRKMATSKLSSIRRLMLYLAAYCVAMFATNMVGEARGIFRVARDVVDKSVLILRGNGYPADTRP